MLAFVLALAMASPKPPPTPPPGMIRVPSGSVTPFFLDAPSRQGDAAVTPERSPSAVAPFLLDARPVDMASFARFLGTHAEWRRSRVKSIFADERYLSTWTSDVDPGESAASDVPVTFVSWFAAKAFCAAQGKRLPTTAEWERALDDGGDKSARADRILAWYAAPSAKSPRVSSASANRFGAVGLVGLVWEWTLDFNDAMVADDGRGGDSELFCGSGGARASDPSDSATFMRYAFRSSLQARCTVKNLGFRCAKDAR